MRRGLLVTALLVGLGLVAGTRGAAPVPQDATPGPRVAPKAPATIVPTIPSLTRNPFEYADAARPGTRRASASSVEPVPTAVAPASVRLAGFVTRGGQLRAALFVQGELALLAIGESAEGYTVLAADEEVGVTLKGPAGEIELPVDQ